MTLGARKGGRIQIGPFAAEHRVKAPKVNGSARCHTPSCLIFSVCNDATTAGAPEIFQHFRLEVSGRAP